MTEELKNFYPTPEEVIQIMTSKIEKIDLCTMMKIGMIPQ